MLGRVTSPFPAILQRLFLVLVSLFASASVLAQPSVPAEQVADEAISDWVATTVPDFQVLQTMGAAELCQLVPTLLVNPPPPAGTTVNVDDRLEQPSVAPGQRIFSYSSSGSAGQLNVVQVTLQESPDGWQVSQVGFRPAAPSGIRAWVQTPSASWAFGAFSLAILVLLARPGGLRRLLARGLQVIREHRRAYAISLGLLTGVFAIGVMTGSQLPAECTATILDTVETAVTNIGATEAYSSGNLARAAVVTFHQNFLVVTASTLFSLALLFGVPAYLFSMLSFYVQAIPFGLIAPGGLDLLLIGILLVLELTAYFTVVAGGGFLLVTLVRKGLRALPEAVGKLLLMLPLAGLLLLVGAWYEALIIIGLP